MHRYVIAYMCTCVNLYMSDNICIRTWKYVHMCVWICMHMNMHEYVSVYTCMAVNICMDVGMGVLSAHVCAHMCVIRIPWEQKATGTFGNPLLCTTLPG